MRYRFFEALARSLDIEILSVQPIVQYNIIVL